MDLAEQERMREAYLIALYKSHAGNYGGDRPNREVCNEAGIDFDTAASTICQYLQRKNFVSWKAGFDWVHLEPEGMFEAERIMKQSYAEKETRVLKTIYEISAQNTVKPVGFHELVPAVGMGDREVSGVCKGLEEQGYIEWPGGDYVQITAAGIHAIELLGQPNPKSGGDTYNMNIGTLHGAAQQGSGNIQNVNITITNNPDFDKAILATLELIKASGLPDDEIEELQSEVARLNRLMVTELKPGLLERAKARIDVVKLGLAVTQALITAGPHLEKIWELLKVKLHLN